MSEDPRVTAARYRQQRFTGTPEHAARENAAAREDAGTPEDVGTPERAGTPEDAGAPAARSGAASAVDRAAYVETAIQQAIRRGEFDDLPGAGKPIPGLGSSHDPDWWIRRKIQTEQLTGLGPPALLLRVESDELEERLDGLSHADDVREALEDFNRRVIEARRQLLGGPPVVTPLRDVELELEAWVRRRADRADPTPDAAPARRRWWRRA